MHRNLRQIVALFLAPCLLADPSFRAFASPVQSRIDLHACAFDHEALSASSEAFAHGGVKYPFLSRLYNRFQAQNSAPRVILSYGIPLVILLTSALVFYQTIGAPYHFRADLKMLAISWMGIGSSFLCARLFAEVSMKGRRQNSSITLLGVVVMIVSCIVGVTSLWVNSSHPYYLMTAEAEEAEKNQQIVTQLKQLAQQLDHLKLSEPDAIIGANAAQQHALQEALPPLPDLLKDQVASIFFLDPPAFNKKLVGEPCLKCAFYYSNDKSVNYRTSADPAFVVITIVHELFHRFYDTLIGNIRDTLHSEKKAHRGQFYLISEYAVSETLSPKQPPPEKEGDETLAEVGRTWTQYPERLFGISEIGTQYLAVKLYIEVASRAYQEEHNGIWTMKFYPPSAALGDFTAAFPGGVREVRIPHPNLKYAEILAIYDDLLGEVPDVAYFTPSKSRVLSYIYGRTVRGPGDLPFVRRGLTASYRPIIARLMNAAGVLDSGDVMESREPRQTDPNIVALDEIVYEFLRPEIRPAYLAGAAPEHRYDVENLEDITTVVMQAANGTAPNADAASSYFAVRDLFDRAGVARTLPNLPLELNSPAEYYYLIDGDMQSIVTVDSKSKGKKLSGAGGSKIIQPYPFTLTRALKPPSLKDPVVGELLYGTDAISLEPSQIDHIDITVGRGRLIPIEKDAPPASEMAEPFKASLNLESSRFRSNYIPVLLKPNARNTVSIDLFSFVENTGHPEQRQDPMTWAIWIDWSAENGRVVTLDPAQVKIQIYRKAAPPIPDAPPTQAAPPQHRMLKQGA